MEKQQNKMQKRSSEQTRKEVQLQNSKLLLSIIKLIFVKEDGKIKRKYECHGQFISVNEQSSPGVILLKYLGQIKFHNLTKLTISFLTIAKIELISWIDAPLLQKLCLKVKRDGSVIEALAKCNFKHLKRISFYESNYQKEMTPNYDLSKISRIIMTKNSKYFQEHSLPDLDNFNRKDLSDLGFLCKLEVQKFNDFPVQLLDNSGNDNIQITNVTEALTRKFGNEIIFILPLTNYDD